MMLEDYVKNKAMLIFIDCPFLSFFLSVLPSADTDLCWTSTSASAGGDFTIRAEWL